jgi:hypothetical protein
MDIIELKKRIKGTKSIKDKSERLLELRDIAEEVANDFTESMSIIEMEIEFVIDRTSQKIKDELGYNDVMDVTRDIDVRPSWEY